MPSESLISKIDETTQVRRFSPRRELGHTGFIASALGSGDLADRSPVSYTHLDVYKRQSGHKAELFLLKSGDEFRKSALARRRLVDVGQPLGEVYVHAPEDLILNKVHYYALSHQPKHIRDIAGILVVARDEIDWAYFTKWAKHLNLLPVWLEVKQEVDEYLSPVSYTHLDVYKRQEEDGSFDEFLASRRGRA